MFPMECFILILICYFSALILARVVESSAPHEMRMEEFRIRRFELNKKETNYFVKFSRSGDVVKLRESSESDISSGRYLLKLDRVNRRESRILHFLSYSK